MPCEQDIGLLLKMITDRVEQRGNRQLRSLGLTFGQSKILMVLGASPGGSLTMKELEERFRSAQSTISGLVSRMEKKGLIECRPAPNDRRAKLVVLAPEGERLRQLTLRDITSTHDLLLSAVPQEERAAFMRQLGAVCTYMNEVCSAEAHDDPAPADAPMEERMVL